MTQTGPEPVGERDEKLAQAVVDAYSKHDEAGIAAALNIMFGTWEAEADAELEKEQRP